MSEPWSLTSPRWRFCCRTRRTRAPGSRAYDTYREAGIAAAWQKFSSFTGVRLQREDAASAPSPDSVAMSERFFLHGLLPIALYQPELPALRAAPTRVVIACGTTSKGQLPQRTAAVLAQRLGVPLVEFPGGHAGFVSDPNDFAALLRQLLV